jgi:membrane associated rhomboid family serine protease
MEDQRSISDILKYPIQLIVALWFIHFSQLFFDLSEWGILPRNIDGVKGIFLGPLVHENLGHIFNNSIPLFVLSSIMMYFYPRVAVRGFAMIYILTGTLVWIFANGNAYHIGISGVVYGLVAFVFWSGIFRKSPRSIILALLTLSLYSDMFAGIFPDQPKISWESHLFGALVGIFVAFYFRSEMELEEEKEIESRKPREQIPYAARPFYFARDTFDMTKEERRIKQEAEAAERRRIAEELQHQEYLRFMQLQEQQNRANNGGLWSQTNTWD